MEVWCKHGNEPQLIKTLLPTKNGWRIARRAENPNWYKDKNGKQTMQFRPFSKLRFKTAALPNRAYDMSGVYPTIHIQKAFNDLMRQYFDGVQIINNPTGRKRRGARINPNELVRKPGNIMTMGDITKDFAWDNVPDIKTSMIEMLNRLDKEFQEASMIVNLLKGIGGTDTATEAQISQQNSQTLLMMINQNIVDALSEAGQMILAISLSNAEGIQSLVLYENEKEMAVLDFDPANIDGMHDIRITPDQTDNTTKAGQNKTIVDFAKLVASDLQTRAKYPTLMEKIYIKFLNNGGIGDTDIFFQEDGPQPQPGESKGPNETIAINYKDAPADIQRQMEAAAGFKPSQIPPAPAPVQTKSPVQPDATGKVPVLQ
jgi:hypothetical protein